MRSERSLQSPPMPKLTDQFSTGWASTSLARLAQPSKAGHEAGNQGEAFIDRSVWLGTQDMSLSHSLSASRTGIAALPSRDLLTGWAAGRRASLEEVGQVFSNFNAPPIPHPTASVKTRRRGALMADRAGPRKSSGWWTRATPHFQAAGNGAWQEAWEEVPVTRRSLAALSPLSGGGAGRSHSAEPLDPSPLPSGTPTSPALSTMASDKARKWGSRSVRFQEESSLSREASAASAADTITPTDAPSPVSASGSPRLGRVRARFRGAGECLRQSRMVIGELALKDGPWDDDSEEDPGGGGGGQIAPSRPPPKN